MGRGRAKAKQTRVARELKYHSPSFDPDRLSADLGGTEDDDTGETGITGTAGHSGWADLYDEDDEQDEARASSY